MGKLASALSADGCIVCYALDSTDMVAEAERIHQSSAVTTAALGRLLTAASILGWKLKGERDTVTLRLDGGGPAGILLAAADSRGNVRGYVQNPIVEIPLNASGKLDVGGAVGRTGTLAVSRDLGLKEPYTGQVPLVSGEIAEDITGYFAVSEQTPTVCGLGVLVNPDLSVKAAGGYLVQLLPFAPESRIETLERNLRALLPVSALIEAGRSPAEICRMLLAGLEPSVLDEAAPAYKCFCSRERTARMLATIQAEELRSMRDEDDGCEVRCHFCRASYRFSGAELDEMLRKRQDAAKAES